MFYHGLMAGLFIGACLGFVGVALLCAARDASLDMGSFLDDGEEDHD